MRRFLAALLLALLPLQIGWASVASYCGHESGAAARHFGHHEHEHHADYAVDGHGARADTSEDIDASTSADSAGGLLAAMADADCSACHLHLAGAIFPPTSPQASPQGLFPAPPTEHRPHAVPTAPPERPQWPRLA